MDGSPYPVTTNYDLSKTVNIGQDPVYLEWGRFDDAPRSLWAYTYIEYLATQHVISGYPGYMFQPNEPNLRAQFAKMLVLGLNMTHNVTGGPHFADVLDTCGGNVDNCYPYTYAETVFNAGIMGGYPCGGPGEPCDGNYRPYFHPSYSMTRGQLAKIIVLAKHWTLISPATPSFTDVPTYDPFYTYIETGHSNNLLMGYSDGTYRPGNVATRAQNSKVIYYAIQPTPTP